MSSGDEVLITAKSAAGRTYAVVKLSAGGYAITRDGERIPDLHWPDRDRKRCMQAFAKITGVDREE